MKNPHIFEGQQLPLKVEVSRDGTHWHVATLLAITDSLSFPYVCNNATYSHARLIGTKESSVMAQLADAEARVKELERAIEFRSVASNIKIMGLGNHRKPPFSTYECDGSNYIEWKKEQS